jgi:transposase
MKSERPPRPRIDGRRLSHATSARLRVAAVRRVLAGESPSAVMAEYGLCRTTIYRWMRAAKSGGVKALGARRHPGRAPVLGADAVRELRRWVVGTGPSDHGMPGQLWGRPAIATLLERRLGVRVGVGTVSRLLARAGLAPGAPLDPVDVRSAPPGSLVLALDRRGRFRCWEVGPDRRDGPNGLLDRGLAWGLHEIRRAR